MKPGFGNIQNIFGGKNFKSSNSKILFWGKYSDISGGHMPNKVTGATDYLTVSGSAGGETYQCPNTAPYISADIDYIWFKSDVTQRTTTTAELIGYDFPRTMVKYDNTTPYALREIIILTAGAVLTTTEENQLRDSMQLSIWWSNVSSDYGMTKGNRSAEQSVWTPESTTDADSDAYIARMTTQPNAATKELINQLFIDLKTAAIYPELDQYVLMNLHDAQASKLDLKTDALNHTWVGTPTWTAKVGVTIAVGKYVVSNYNPVVNTVKFTKDNCGLVFTQSGVTGAGCSGLCSVDNTIPASRRISIYQYDHKDYMMINGDNVAYFNKELKAGFNFWARISSTQVTIRTGGAEETINSNSAGLPGISGKNTFVIIGALMIWNSATPATYTVQQESVGSVFAQYGFASKLDSTKREAFQTLIDAFNIAIQTSF